MNLAKVRQKKRKHQQLGGGDGVMNGLDNPRYKNGRKKPNRSVFGKAKPRSHKGPPRAKQGDGDQKKQPRGNDRVGHATALLVGRGKELTFIFRSLLR